MYPLCVCSCWEFLSELRNPPPLLAVNLENYRKSYTFFTSLGFIGILPNALYASFMDFWKPYDWRIKWWCRNVQNMQKIPIPWLKITAIQSRCWKGSSSDTKLFFFKFTLLSFMNPFCRIFLSLLILPWNHHQLKSDSGIFQFWLCLISITLITRMSWRRTLKSVWKNFKNFNI